LAPAECCRPKSPPPSAFDWIGTTSTDWTNFNNWWNNTPYANKHAAVIAAITHRLGPSLNPRVVAMAANTPEDKIHTHEKKVAQWWETWLNHLLEHIDEYAEEADSSSND